MVDENYITKGPAESNYVNGNSTVVYEVLPANATYNVKTDMPNPPYDASAGGGSGNASKLMTRAERAVVDAEKMKRNANLPWHMTRRATTKKGRAMLFDDAMPSRRKHSHGHAWKGEL